MVSVPLWGTSLLEKKPIIEEEQQERFFQDTENRFMDNNITRATTGLHAESLAGEESLLDPLASETATGNFQGISITQEEPTIETLDHLSTSALKQFKGVMETRESPLMRVVENYNRVDLINKKVATYEHELKNLKASTAAAPNAILSNRILVLESLITVLQAASDYQKKMINHLKEAASDQDERKAALKESHLLANLLKINEASNKIERVAKQIENDAYAIEWAQKLILALEKVEAQIPGLPANNPVTLDSLAPERACHRLKKFITFQQALISKRVLYGTSLRPPYEKLKEEAQEAIQKNKENCLQKETEARKEGVLASYELSPNIVQQIARNEAVEEAQKPHPNPEVIAWYTKSADLYQQAVRAEDLGQQQKAIFLNNAGDALFQTAKEAQKPDPNAEVIEWYTKSEHLYQQALTAEDLGQQQKAIFLNDAGDALVQKAKEAQKPHPNPEVIAWYTKSADLYQQAVRAEDLGQQEKVRFLNDGSVALFQKAQEAQKPDPNAEVIEWYTKSEHLYQQALRAEDLGQQQKAIFLGHVGYAFFHVAQEARKPDPNAEVIAWYTKSADLYQQAVTAEDLGQQQKAIFLNNAGDALFQKAQEAQKPDPNPEFIAWYTKSEHLYQQALRAADLGQQDKARILNNAGRALFRIAKEAQKPHPNQKVIEWYTKSENLYQQALRTEDLGQQDKARFLNNRGVAFFNVAEEAQKPHPNQEVIEWYTKSENLYQQALRAEDLGQQDKARFLINAARALFRIAKEAQKPHSNAEVIEWYTKSENLYQQALRAEDLGQQDKARFLNNGGVAFFNVAEEAQKPHPNQDVINQYLEKAQENMDKAYNDASSCVIS